MPEIGNDPFCRAEDGDVSCHLLRGHMGPHDDWHGTVWGAAGEPIWSEQLPAGEPVAARDPRWEWVEVTLLGQDPAHPSYVKGRCRHIELGPVGGTVAAPLYRCGTCGAHLRTELAPPVLNGQPL